MHKNNVFKIKNNKGKKMNTDIFNKMMQTVEDFTVEYMEEIQKGCGYTLGDIVNNTGGARVALSEGVALILNMIYGEKALSAFLDKCDKDIIFNKEV